MALEAKLPALQLELAEARESAQVLLALTDQSTHESLSHVALATHFIVAHPQKGVCNTSCVY